MVFVVLGLVQEGDRLILSEVSAPWAQDRATVAAALRAALAVMEAPQDAPAAPATRPGCTKVEQKSSTRRRRGDGERMRG